MTIPLRHLSARNLLFLAGLWYDHFVVFDNPLVKYQCREEWVDYFSSAPMRYQRDHFRSLGMQRLLLARACRADGLS